MENAGNPGSNPGGSIHAQNILCPIGDLKIKNSNRGWGSELENVQCSNGEMKGERNKKFMIMIFKWKNYSKN